MKICVVGAGGSIGSRLIKRLLDDQHEVVAVLRSLSSASRIGRYAIDIVQHDILTVTQTELQQTFDGCDVVIDCSFSKAIDYAQRLEESVAMATIIANAVLYSGVQKLIHYGTVSVYPTRQQGHSNIDETTVCTPRNDAYADSKLAAENVLLDKAKTDALPLVILQLPVVYGPFMLWSQAPVMSMYGKRWLMPNDLAGVCTPLHVDDVVLATCLAMQTQTADGQRILLAGTERLTWGEYYQAYADLDSSLSLDLVGRNEVMTELTLQARQQQPWNKLKSAFSNDVGFRQLVLSQFGFRHLYKLVRHYRGEQGIASVKGKLLKPKQQPLKGQPKQYIDAKTLSVLDTMPDIQTDKAQRLLNFKATISFEKGMQDTHKWLKWARLV